MRLETISGPRVIDTIDRALIGLIGATRTPGIYEVGHWRIKVTSSRGHSTAVSPAPDAVIHRLCACLTAYEADTDKWEYKRIFRNEIDDIWVCECTNES